MVMDKGDFVRVAMEQKDRAHTHAVYMLGNPEDAREVTQEALMRLWQHRRRVATPAAATWLRRTIHNLCLDRLRRRSSRPTTSPESLEDHAAPNHPAAEHPAETNELRLQIGRALQELLPRDRALIVMREMEGMSYAQMSAVLGLPDSTLKVALHRARERLRGRLISAGVRP